MTHLVQQDCSSSTPVNATYSYNLADLITARVVNGTTTGYAYDAQGTRIQRRADANGDGTYETVERFAADADGNVWADLDGSNALVTRRLYGLGADTPVFRVSSAGTATWYLTDRQQSVTGLADAAGALIGSIAYNGFGQTVTDTTGVARDRLGFTARESDSAVKLQYNRARYYDPAVGRWISMDPEGFGAGDANLYRYVGNNSTNASDPSGRYFITRGTQNTDEWLQSLRGSEHGFLNVKAAPTGEVGAFAASNIYLADERSRSKVAAALKQGISNDPLRNLYKSLLGESAFDAEGSPGGVVEATKLAPRFRQQISEIRANYSDGMPGAPAGQQVADSWSQFRQTTRGQLAGHVLENQDFIAGLGEAGAGILVFVVGAPTGGGAACGVYMAWHGADTVHSAAIRKVTGRSGPTLTNKALESVVGRDAADTIEPILSALAGAGSMSQAKPNVGSWVERSESQWQQGLASRYGIEVEPKRLPSLGTTPASDFVIIRIRPGDGFVEVIDTKANVIRKVRLVSGGSDAPLNNPAHNAANYQRLRDFYASQHTGPLGPADGLADLARFRGQLGNVPGGGQANGGVVARLDAGGHSFYGVNAHGQPNTLRVNAITATHAEMDAFQQAANANVRGGTGRLFVDRNLCDSCDLYGGVRSMARQLGLERLEVITPSGTPVIIIP